MERRRRLASALFALALTAGLVATGCGPRKPPRPVTGAPKLLTVPAIERMVQMGMTTPAIVAEIQKSGTVYNLTEQQIRDLRAVGMSPALIGQMQQTYQNALRKNPNLSRSGQYWAQVDNYWYGGVPVGWPRDWVGGTAPGKAKR